MTAIAAQTTAIHLEADCCDGSLANRMRNQLDTPNYTRGVSLMPVPDSVQEWQAEHRTARKRAWRAQRLGYAFAEVDMSIYSHDRHEINTSLPERQGRRMSEGYLTKRNIGKLPDYPCDRHRIHTFGVLQEERLRAYMTLYRVGDLALVSMILGHGDHLANDIMYLLFAGAVQHQAGMGGWFYYNRWDSGTDGLRYFKSRIGFECCDVQWELS